MKDEDLVEHLFVANTHDHLLIFSNTGKVYWLKVYKIPEGSRTAKGKALINLINLSPGETVAAIIPVKEFNTEEYLLLATKNGVVKKTKLEAYSRPRQTGIIGITLDEDDQVISVRKTSGNDEILLGTKRGQAIRFSEKNVRPIGRTGRGVRGITLNKDDEVIGCILARPNETILTITENGYGKRTPIEEYRLINRGGKGVRNIICSERNGNVVNIRRVKGDESLLLISEKGILIRTSVAQINSIGRNTQGVRVMNLTSGDKVQRVAIMRTEEYEDKPQNEKESEENNEKINTNNNEFNNKVQPQN
jgi:DNA gyrase subunit A